LRLTETREVEIDERFKEAEEASDCMGRKDWTPPFMDSIAPLMPADVITPGIFQQLSS
jgi:hypothetical protein